MLIEQTISKIFTIDAWVIDPKAYNPCEYDPDYEPEMFELFRKIRRWGINGGVGFVVNLNSPDLERLKSFEYIIQEIQQVLNKYDIEGWYNILDGVDIETIQGIEWHTKEVLVFVKSDSDIEPIVNHFNNKNTLMKLKITL